jgi:uncharacterized protein YecT (DUF1311 family)
VSLVALAVSLAVAAQPPDGKGCDGTTIEVNACLGKVLDAVEAEHLKYAAAARARLKRAAESVGPDERGLREAPADFEKAETAWAAYRDAECGAVYAYYSSGTIRESMDLTCELRLTRLHTHAIWSEWLTYVDSTPPLLPEPPIPPRR